MLKDFFDIFKNYFEKDIRPSFSNVIYLFSGVLLFFSIFIKILPFSCNIECLKSFLWNDNLKYHTFIVVVAFCAIIVHMITCVIKKIFVFISRKTSKNTQRDLYLAVHTIDDIVDLIVSIIVFAFMFTIFIQVYKTGVLFSCSYALFIYAIVSIRFISFLGSRFRFQNLKIINGVLDLG